MNKKEIIYNLVNTGLAGLLVFLGACVDGDLTGKGIVAAVLAGLIVFVTKFKNVWEKNKPTGILFNFL